MFPRLCLLAAKLRPTNPSRRFSHCLRSLRFIPIFFSRRDDYWPAPDKAFPLISLSRFLFNFRSFLTPPRNFERTANPDGKITKFFKLSTFNHRNVSVSPVSVPRLNLTDEIAFARGPMFLNGERI